MRCPECGKRRMVKLSTVGTVYYDCTCGGYVVWDRPRHREVNPLALIFWPALVIVLVYVLL